LPERTDVAAAYSWRIIVLLLVPFSVTLAGVLIAGGPGSEPAGDWAFEGFTYAMNSIVLAAIARSLLALAACAVGDRALTFRASWRLTRGHWWAMFRGYLACSLPFNAAAFWLGDVSLRLAEGSMEQAAADNLASVVGVMGEVVAAAFLSYAYLHFTRGQPSEREPAGYFS
jgi:hypothetical protein